MVAEPNNLERCRLTLLVQNYATVRYKYTLQVRKTGYFEPVTVFHPLHSLSGRCVHSSPQGRRWRCVSLSPGQAVHRCPVPIPREVPGRPVSREEEKGADNAQEAVSTQLQSEQVSLPLK